MKGKSLAQRRKGSPSYNLGDSNEFVSYFRSHFWQWKQSNLVMKWIGQLIILLLTEPFEIGATEWCHCKSSGKLVSAADRSVLAVGWSIGSLGHSSSREGSLHGQLNRQITMRRLFVSLHTCSVRRRANWQVALVVMVQLARRRGRRPTYLNPTWKQSKPFLSKQTKIKGKEKLSRNELNRLN